MAASAFSRLYRKVMGRTLSPLGFQRKWSEFWRERGGVLHVIALHRGDENFTVDVAVQPLVDPFETFSLTLGARLHRFGPGIPPRWGVPEDKVQMAQVLEECAQLVLKFAVPWLDRFQSTRDIVQIAARNAWGVRIMGTPSNVEEYAALCALDAGMFDQGKKLVKKVYKEYYADLEEHCRRAGIDVPEWDRKRQKMFRELLELLEKGDLEGVRRRLEENKAYTRKALGID
jgi:hypothetical protein